MLSACAAGRTELVDPRLGCHDPGTASREDTSHEEVVGVWFGVSTGVAQDGDAIVVVQGVEECSRDHRTGRDAGEYEAFDALGAYEQVEVGSGEDAGSSLGDENVVRPGLQLRGDLRVVGTLAEQGSGLVRAADRTER